MAQNRNGVEFTREQFMRDPKGCLEQARQGFSVTVQDSKGLPAMRLEVPPPCSAADSDDDE